MDVTNLQDLPRLTFCHILSFLSHSSLLNFSLTSKTFYGLIMREWNTNPSLWYHITIPSNLSIGGVIGLWKILKGKHKLKFVRSIRISNSEKYLTGFMLNLLCHFHQARRIVIESKIKLSHIVKILSAFKKDSKCVYCKNCKRQNFHKTIQYVEMTKLNIVLTKLNHS